MNIALIAQDSKKELMAQFSIAYCGVLSKHHLCATSGTGKIVSDAASLPVVKFLSGDQGGCEQISARISCKEVDMLIFFRDPMHAPDNQQSHADLLRLCDVHNIPFATNIATAEALIHALERGDFEWRNMVR